MRNIAQFTLPGNQPAVPPSGIPGPITGNPEDILKNIFGTGFDLLFLAAIFLAVILIIFSGIGLITSGGDSEKLASARKRLLYAVIGLVVVMGAFFITKVVITVFGGNPDFFFKFN